MELSENDLVAQGVNMIMPDNLKPNAQYVLQKIRGIVDGEPITPTLLTQLALQAMMFAANSGPGLGGSLKKDVVMYSLRKLVLESKPETLDLTSKTALFMLLQDEGVISVTIDQLVFVWKGLGPNFSGTMNRFGCKCFGQKPAPLPADFNQKSIE